MNNGQFVVICGIDGSGKTSLINALNINSEMNWMFTDWKKFSNVIDMTYDLEGTSIPKFIEELSSFTRSALFLYLFGLQLDKIILPGLKKGKTIISDSYWYKFVAKMEVTQHGDRELLNICNTLIKPHKIILLDTSPEIAFRRKVEFNFYETFGKIENFVSYQTEIRNKILNYITFSDNLLILNDDMDLSEKIIKSINFINLV